MRRLNLLLSILLFVPLCGLSQSDSTVPLMVSIKLEETKLVQIANTAHYRKLYGSTDDSLSKTRYTIKVDLINRSKKPVFIWLMSCSWLDNFLVNNNYIGLESQQCDSNFPERVEIAPGNTKSFRMNAYKSLKITYDKKAGNWPRVKGTRLGIITIADFHHPITPVDYNMAMDDKSRWRIIWSNPLYLLSKEEETPAPLIFDVIVY